MDNVQMITVIGSILVPMLGGFGWVIHQLSGLERRLGSLETRVTVIETLLSVMGMPIRPSKPKIEHQ